jgi:hypothetical protein
LKIETSDVQLLYGTKSLHSTFKSVKALSLSFSLFDLKFLREKWWS